MQRILIIGQGSIGKKHNNLLMQQGATSAFVSSKQNSKVKVFKDIHTAVKDFKPNSILITSSTSKHYSNLIECRKLLSNTKIFIEKPIFDKIPNNKINPQNIFCLYNLRHSDIIEKCKELLNNEEILTCDVFCGQLLSQWRSDRNHLETYSAKKSEGGGVLRDLSHELDYSIYLLGDIKSLIATGGKASNVTIDSEDTFTILAKTKKCNYLSINLNYLEHFPRRQIHINTNTKTILVDLIESTISINNEIIYKGQSLDETYRIQIKRILSNELDSFCTYNEALNTLRVIEAAEISNKNEKKVSL